MNEKEIVQKIVGTYCKEYRKDKLKIDLNTLSKLSDIPYKTLYSFETGLSSNIYIFTIYFKRSEDKTEFLNGLKEVLKG